MLKITTTTSILLVSIIAITYSPIGEVFGGNVKEIYIVNNLEVPLEFNEVKNRQDVEIKSQPPDKVEAGTTGSFNIAGGDEIEKNEHLNVQYYVDGSSSGEQVGIVYKWDFPDNDGKCPKDHPDDIIEEVKHCSSWDNNNNWEYIFSPK